MSIRFDGQVAIVTGAGLGLGRSHALGLAARGAKVVVNDLGGARDGSGGNRSAAETVVEEIRQQGGEAIANGANVSEFGEVEDMVAQALNEWGRVDILVNNAGILRDKSFAKLDLDDFSKVMDVHLMGAVNSTKACWELMREQAYGRIVMTSSASGLYGNFGQSNYAAAKMAVVGLMNTLCQEGAKYDIRVNALAPCAATRMTEGLLPEQAYELLQPETVTPGLLYLVSTDGPNRCILSAGGGSFAVTRIEETPGVCLLPDDLSPEGIAENWQAISAGEGQRELQGAFDQTTKLLEKTATKLGIELA